MTSTTGSPIPDPGGAAGLGPPGPPRWLGEPMRIDPRGRAARVSDDQHVVDLIRSVLFTEPGERVNRPDYGCALRTMVFLPNSDTLAAATRTLVHAALQQWLGDKILVDRIDVSAEGATLSVQLLYRRTSDGAAREVTVSSR